MGRVTIEENHPLRKLFRKAIHFGLRVHPSESIEVVDYIEEDILCEFIHADNLYRITDASGKRLEDMADMMEEGSILLNAQSFQREFQVHKHIGDYTLFMLSMFPEALTNRKGKEFVFGSIVIPNASLEDHYVLQGQRSYRIASEFANRELFRELSSNFSLYKNILELVRIFLESARHEGYSGLRDILSGTA